jgi:hypothetical protein
MAQIAPSLLLHQTVRLVSPASASACSQKALIYSEHAVLSASSLQVQSRGLQSRPSRRAFLEILTSNTDQYISHSLRTRYQQLCDTLGARVLSLDCLCSGCIMRATKCVGSDLASHCIMHFQAVWRRRSESAPKNRVSLSIFNATREIVAQSDSWSSRKRRLLLSSAGAIRSGGKGPFPIMDIVLR